MMKIVAMRALRSEGGVSLMEMLVALFILAVVGVAVIVGVGTSIKGTDLTRTRITAESLVRTELEYVFSLPYDGRYWTYTLTKDSKSYPTGWKVPLTFPPDYSTGYSITVSASENSTPGNPYGKQKITAVVKYSNNQDPATTVLTIVTYRSQ